MEDGDSDTDKYPHRTGNNAGSDELYGIASPQPLPQKGRGFLVRRRAHKKRTGILHAPLSFELFIFKKLNLR